MKVIHISDVEKAEATSELFFGGKVEAQRLIDDTVAETLKVSLISFGPGARNKPHTHTFEQVLWVTSGKGILATEKEEHVLTPGMVAYIPAGQPHWHGATDDSEFAHISIAMQGETKF
jgi:quercetin dioxygenase-like cupin family protein